METFKISAKKREITGKKVKKLRKEKLIPGAMYKGPNDSVNIILNEVEISKVVAKAGMTSLIDLDIDGSTPTKVLIQEIQYNPRDMKALHISFHAVNLSEEITTEIPIEITGEAPAIKTYGGVVVNPVSELTIKCLPANIPHSIIIDVSKLENIGDGILLSDIKLPEGVRLVHTDEEALSQTILTISAPQAEEIPVETVASETTDEADGIKIELSVKKGKDETEEITKAKESPTKK